MDTGKKTYKHSVRTGREISVLVIDDEENVRIVLSRVLIAMGFKADTASEGHEGLQKLLKTDYDLVIVDLNMRSMNGIAFIQEARKIWPWLSVIILTGFDSAEERKQAVALGITNILRKPCSTGILQTAIENELNLNKPSPEQQCVVSKGGLMKGQLSILRQISESAMNAETVFDALTELGVGLARLQPCSAVVLLYACDTPAMLIVEAMVPLSEKMIEALENNILTGFEAVSGETLNKDLLDIRILNQNGEPEAHERPESLVTIPVIIKEKVCAMFSLASMIPDAYTQENISFLYHAANHLSMVMLALSQMRQLATHDALTGLYNHASLEEKLEHAWFDAEKNNSDIGLAIMDIDYFKSVNDVYGHLVGDQALKELGELVKKNAEPSGIAGRYGGDELLIIFPGKTEDEVALSAVRLLKSVENHVFSITKHNIKMTISIGVASRNSSDATNPTELLSRADQALYDAKKTGKNKIYAYAPPNSERSVAQAQNKKQKVAFRQQRPPASILIADDEQGVIQLLRSCIPSHHHIRVAETFQQTLDMVKVEKLDIILLDIHFPDGEGLDLLPMINEMENPPIVIVISGDKSAEYTIKSLRSGAYDFITKPFRKEEIVSTIERAAEIRRLRMEEKRYHHYLEELVREKSATLTQALADVQNSYEVSMEVLASLIDAREHNTGKHSSRVNELAMIIGKAMNLPEPELDVLSKASLLHDIGKVAIPDYILLKNGSLSSDETTVMRSHPSIGMDILQSNPYLRDAAEIVYSHHEKYDGTGYPRGLKGEEICLGARIFAVIDAYDAMRTQRVYSLSAPPDEAAAEIRRCSGSHFDPVVVGVFLERLPEIEKVGHKAWDEP